MKNPLHPLLLMAIFAGILLACQPTSKESENTAESENAMPAAKPKFSLAQWSFNKALFAGEMSNVDFINTAAEMGFEGVEYVSQFFQEKVEDRAFLDSLNTAAQTAGIKNLLIMVDRAGELGAVDTVARNQAVDAHKKWIDAAKYLGCHSIRINAHGGGTAEELMAACIDAIGKLSEYGQQQGVSVLIENHGGYSNNGEWLTTLVEALKDKGVGTLPDFDNWCITRENGELWGAPCIESYDRYKGLEELLPYAGALSVKSFDFNESGEETTMDYARFFRIIRAANYDGFLGIEFEGHDMPPREGIKKTMALVERVWDQK